MKVIVGSDLHIPFQHDEAVDEFLAYIKREKPGVVILNGDIKDAYHVSSHMKKPDMGTISDASESLQVIDFLKRVWKAAPYGCRLYYLCGNHELRMEKYLLRNAPALYFGEGWKIPMVLRLDENDFAWVEYGEMVEIDGVTYMHGELLSCIPGNSVRKHVQKFGRPMVVGHCHRGSVINMRFGGKLMSGMECGCLCTEKAGSDYVRAPDWHLGWGKVVDGKMEFILAENQL